MNTLSAVRKSYTRVLCAALKTVAGSVLKLNKGVWNVYTNSDIPLYECVNCASLNIAETLGIEKKKGSLEIGKDADIIIADGEFNIEKTIIGGCIRYES